MIDYKISWSPGTNPFGWSGTPSLVLDPLRRALDAHLQRDWHRALAAYIEALRARPNRALAAYNFGLLHIDQGMGLLSVPFLLRAALLEPGSATYQGALLFARLRSGDLAEGEALLARCEQGGVPIDLALWRHFFAQVREGIAAAALNLPTLQPLDPLAVRELPDRPLTLQTQSPCHAGLAESYAHLQQLYLAKRLPELLEELAPLLDQHRDWGEGHHLHGSALYALRRWEPAAKALIQASQLLPGRADVWDSLGTAFDAIEDFLEASHAYDHSLALNPLWYASWNNAANAAVNTQRFDHAYQYALMALTLAPDNGTCLLNFALACQGRSDYSRARQALSALIDLDPQHPQAEQVFGILCLELGDHDEARDHLNRAIAIAPNDLVIHSSLIFINNYLGVETQEDIHVRARRFGQLLTQGLEPRASWPNDPDPNRPLRIGFVSGDLRQHSVGVFFVSVAQALALSTTLELYAYPTTRDSDRMTDAFRSIFHHWVPIPGLDDDEAAARILADGIDILVDLSGHTDKHRLGLFARKPAPLQITWLGYFGTTGLTQIDYLLAGPWDVPPREEAEFSETIWRLPHTRLCFSPPQVTLPVTPLPAMTAGHLTFGSFNNIRKVTDRVVAVWARILKALPDARLFLKSWQLEGEAGRAAVAARFLAEGVTAERLILEGPSAFADYLAAYGRVDIALDPFPYPGGTTSIQALWMGVPVLTLAGDRLLARQGESMLRALDMDEWVAATEGDYVEMAVRLAQALEPLQSQRGGLRARLEQSPLMNSHQFATDLESAFRAMWLRWCAGGTAERETRT